MEELTEKKLNDNNTHVSILSSSAQCDTEMNVMLLITDSFTYYSLPFIYSLIINNKWANIKIYLLTDSLNNDNRKILSDCISLWGGVLHIIDVDTSIFRGLRVIPQYPALLYYKLIPHTVLPKNISRIAYFDVDMIVTGSLEEYYKTDMGDNYFGGCHDVGPFKRLYQGNAVGIFKKYINSGSVLYNLDLLRGADVNLSIYKAFLNGRTQRLFEEWLLNNVFADKIYNFYPLDYNYNPGQRDFYKEFCLNKNITAKERIIHYMPCGNDSPIIKPWDAYEYFYFDKKNTIFNDELFGLYQTWWIYAKQLPINVLNCILLQAQKAKLQKDKAIVEGERNTWRINSDTFKALILNGLADINMSHSLANALLQMGYKDIAIYGYTEISKVLVTLLKDTDISIAYIVENTSVSGIKTLPRDTTEFFNVDIMLVADVANYNQLVTKLSGLKLSFPVFKAHEFLSKLENNDDSVKTYTAIKEELERKQKEIEDITLKFNILDKELVEKKQRLDISLKEISLLKAENESVKDDYNAIKQRNLVTEEKYIVGQNQLKEMTAKADNFASILSDMEESLSFRIGRIITFIPRKVRDVLKRKH